MALIDLGEAPREPPLDGAPPPRRPAARRLGLVAVLALLAGTVAGAGPAPRPLPSAVVPAPLGAVVVLADGRLFVIDPRTTDPAPQLSPQFTAYRLPDGTPMTRVRLSLPLDGPYEFAGRVGDILLLTDATGPEPQRRVIGLNATTGAVAWRRDARFDGLTTAGDALLWTGPDNPEGGPDPGGVLTAVDVANGADRWSQTYPARTARSVRYDPARGEVSLLVNRLPSGRLELRDVASGQLLRGIDLPPPAPDADWADWFPDAVGEVVLIRETGGALTAYGVGGLERRWTIRANADRTVWARDCGPVICMNGPQNGVRAIDAATGVARWTNDQLVDAQPYADRLVGVGLDPAKSPGIGPISVLDPRTGRVLADLGSWQVVGPSADGRRAYGVRYGGGGEAWVAELDPTAGSAVVLDRLSQVSTDCQARYDTLVCRRLDGALGLWDLAG